MAKYFTPISTASATFLLHCFLLTISIYGLLKHEFGKGPWLSGKIPCGMQKVLNLILGTYNLKKNEVIGAEKYLYQRSGS